MSAQAYDDSPVMVIMGEIHTGLVQHSTALTQSRCERLLALVDGESVRRFERPMPYVVSPDLLTGVDCRLPTLSGAKARGVGTVISRAAITGGHVLQVPAVARVVRDGTGRRRPWSHYLARPGRLELVGKADDLDLARGYVGTRSSGRLLDLAAICGRLMDAVQLSPELDRAPPLRATRTRLRWAATVTAPAPADGVRIRIEDGRVSALQLACTPQQAAEVAEFCADLALHDWLLTTLLHLMRRSRIGAAGSTRAVDGLRPAVDHLLHLWMPAARLDESVCPLWDSLERRPGLTRQWQASVDRIRDQMSLSTIALLSARLAERTG